MKGARGECIEVTAHLPGARSAADVSLEVEGTDLHLTWPGPAAAAGGGSAPLSLVVPLTAAVDLDAAAARFVKATGALVVTLPLVAQPWPTMQSQSGSQRPSTC